MFVYDSSVTKLESGKFLAVILKTSHDAPNSDTVMERELDTMGEALIWVDDELSRLTTGKGVWE